MNIDINQLEVPVVKTRRMTKNSVELFPTQAEVTESGFVAQVTQESRKQADAEFKKQQSALAAPRFPSSQPVFNEMPGVVVHPPIHPTEQRARGVAEFKKQQLAVAASGFPSSQPVFNEMPGVVVHSPIHRTDQGERGVAQPFLMSGNLTGVTARKAEKPQ